MTTPDTRDSVERIVAEMRRGGGTETGWIGIDTARGWADRLQALARGPQQAGGEVQRFRPTLQKSGQSPKGYIAVMTAKDDPRDSDWRVEESRAWVRYTDYAALQAEVARRTDSVIVVGATSLACSSAVKEMFDLMSQRAEAAEAALREAHTLPETWRNKWDGGCCCDAAGHECADALDAAIGGTGDA